MAHLEREGEREREVVQYRKKAGVPLILSEWAVVTQRDVIVW